MLKYNYCLGIKAGWIKLICGMLQERRPWDLKQKEKKKRKE